MNPIKTITTAADVQDDPALRILKRAARILSKPEAWTKKAEARTETGKEIFYDSNRAVCFCSMGAIWRARKDILGTQDCDDDYSVLRKVVKGAHTGIGIVDWNDAPERTHAEVLAAFQEAIAQREQDLIDYANGKESQ